MQLFLPKVMNKLRVALVQPDLYWLQPQRNLDHLSQLLQQHFSKTHSFDGHQANSHQANNHQINSHPATTDMVVLPEMFTSGFTDTPEPLYGDQQTIRWMCEQASLYDIAIVGSIACEVPVDSSEDSPRYVNRLLFVTPEGVEATYDKCHLFQMGGEHKRYRAGSERCIIDYKGWRLLLTICYDLRFPVFCRNQQDYDAMICVANWPKPRRHAWRTLLQARAIENQAYVLGVNRVGIDGKGLEYQGDSMIVDMLGELLADGAQGDQTILNAELSMEKLNQLRDSFPVWKDADSFQLV